MERVMIVFCMRLNGRTAAELISDCAILVEDLLFCLRPGQAMGLLLQSAP